MYDILWKKVLSMVSIKINISLANQWIIFDVKFQFSMFLYKSKEESTS